MNVIYYDMMEVSDDIKSFVNIDRFGDLHYKKMSLFEHSQKLFKENEIKRIYRISSKGDLKAVLDKIAYLESEDFLFVSSNMVIVDKDLFSVFIKKIKYLEGALALCGLDCIKPFVKLPHKDIGNFLTQVDSGNVTIEELINQKKDSLEKFSREKFYHEIKSYSDFVTYLQSSFELRFFNSIQNTGNIITKRSQQKDKMKKEYNFYSVLPDEMKLYFLPPFRFKEYETYAEYSLEKLQVLDLSIQWIHHSVKPNEFSVFLNRLFEFIKIRKTSVVSKPVSKENSKDLYFDKLFKRVDEFKKTPVFGIVNNIIADSTEYDSFDKVLEKYLKLYNKISNRSSESYLVLGHGDLCFSNILYDKRIGLLKLIDPRGCNTETEGYMDCFYDIAKLSHSILGNYDFINSGIFDIKYNQQLKVELEITGTEHLALQKSMFKSKLNEYGFSYSLIRIYEASLFLSMLPLHIDYPKKVLAFILTAISILEELENEETFEI